MTVSNKFDDQGSMFMSPKDRYEFLLALIPKFSKTTTLNLWYKDGIPDRVVYEATQLELLTEIPLHWLLVVLTLCDEITISDYRQGIHNQDVTGEIKAWATEKAYLNIEANAVVWVGPDAQGNHQTIRLTDLSTQLWATVTLVLLIESDEGRHYLRDLGNPAITTIMKVYNSALGGVAAQWILDGVVEQQIVQLTEEQLPVFYALDAIIHRHRLAEHPLVTVRKIHEVLYVGIHQEIKNRTLTATHSVYFVYLKHSQDQYEHIHPHHRKEVYDAYMEAYRTFEVRD